MIPIVRKFRLVLYANSRFGQSGTEYESIVRGLQAVNSSRDWYDELGR